MPRADYSEYRKMNEDTGQWEYFCPDCTDGESPRVFTSLGGWKSHMQTQHGGLVDSGEPESSAAPSPETGAGAVPAPVPPKPKKLSNSSRELNKKLNDCINLVMKHFIKGLDDLEMERLEVLRNEVSMAWMGVEFDFDDKLVTISGKWAALVVITALYILPQLPTMKQMLAKVKEQRQAKK